MTYIDSPSYSRIGTRVARCTFTLLVVLSVSAPALAQEHQGDKGSVDQQVIAASNAWFDALVHRDATALDQLLTDDFQTIQPARSGVAMLGKPEQLASIRQGGGIPAGARRTLSRTRVRSYGTTALLTAVATFEAENAAGARLRTEMAITEVWVDQGGKWRLAHYQTTNPPVNAAAR